jgi:hypothetical protein
MSIKLELELFASSITKEVVIISNRHYILLFFWSLLVDIEGDKKYQMMIIA